MSEAKFTKGEWSISVDCWADGHVSIDGFEHSAIAVVVSEMDDGSKKEELSANAHLIAAAPKMYGLLSRLANPNNCKKDIIHLLSEVDNLLAEARGG